jgi:hypothetical protein
LGELTEVSREKGIDAVGISFYTYALKTKDP